jgi:hypothetical protein
MPACVLRETIAADMIAVPIGPRRLSARLMNAHVDHT